MKTELVRIGFILPENIQNKFDEVIKNKGYANYSEAIRDVMRKFISEYDWIDDFEGHHAGIASIIYDHTKRGLTDDLLDIQQNYFHLTRFCVNVYIGHDDFLEIIVLDGNGEEIKELSRAMTALNGVKFSDISTIPMAKKT